MTSETIPTAEEACRMTRMIPSVLIIQRCSVALWTAIYNNKNHTRVKFQQGINIKPIREWLEELGYKVIVTDDPRDFSSVLHIGWSDNKDD